MCQRFCDTFLVHFDLLCLDVWIFEGLTNYEKYAILLMTHLTYLDVKNVNAEVIYPLFMKRASLDK